MDDFAVYDLIYSGKDKEHPGEKDPNIVIVQTEDSRDAIWAQIKMVQSLQPAVLGIDLSFQNYKDSANVISS